MLELSQKNLFKKEKKLFMFININYLELILTICSWNSFRFYDHLSL